MTPVPPVRREIVVPAPPAVAFDVFTHAVDTWWPVASHSVHGAAAHVAFRDGEIVESAPGEDDCSWGTVLTWEPPTRLAFTAPLSCRVTGRSRPDRAPPIRGA